MEIWPNDKLQLYIIFIFYDALIFPQKHILGSKTIMANIIIFNMTFIISIYFSSNIFTITFSSIHRH